MEKTPHLLIVDDQEDIRDPLARYLETHGMRTTAAANAAEARRCLKDQSIDLVVLDIMMPGEDGLSLCRHLRETSAIPVILLTAMGEDMDRVVGLEMGADDYVTKPFNPRELLARVKAVMRRTQSLPPQGEAGPASGVLRFDRWALDQGRRELLSEEGVSIPLSTAEFDLLSAFLRYPGVTLSRDRLLDLARGREAMPFDRSIDNQVSRLRKKLETDPKNPVLIKTVWGGGYLFTADVREEG